MSIESLQNYDRWGDNPELTDTRVVVVGNLTDGYEVHGPFNGFDSAADYAEYFSPVPTWIMKLEEPSLHE